MLLSRSSSSVFVVLTLLAACSSEQSSSCPQADGVISDGVARFSPPDVACEDIPASFALLEPMPPTDGVPVDWPTRPVLSVDGDSYRAAIPIDEGTTLYGTGEIAGPLERSGFVTETWGEQPWNPDAEPGTSPGEYDDKTPRLFQSHPWVLGVRADGSSFGALADTTYRTEIDLRNGIKFTARAPPL